jgi:hypothetical protein
MKKAALRQMTTSESKDVFQNMYPAPPYLGKKKGSSRISVKK